MLNLIENIRAKIENGARVSDAEALALFESDDLLAVGELAAMANRRINGDKVYFNVNRHINYTNICVNRCTFCAFSREDEADQGSYTLALNDILERAAEAADAGAKLPGLLAYMNQIESVREWPFDAPTLTRFFLYVAIPLGSWVGGALVERLLGAALD